jgi:hypothetical protein
MENTTIAISQFDGSVKLLRVCLATGERDLIPANEIHEDEIAFGLFDFEKSETGLDSVALVATPEGPLFFLKNMQYRPALNKTKIKIDSDGNYFHFQILHEENHIFGLFYKEKSGIGLHPYNRSREDIDFYYWLCKKINMPQFYQTYTRDIKYLKQKH